MTRDPEDGGITTEAEFEATLDQVLLEAIRNGVDPRGSWEFRKGQGAPDLEVVVLELAKRDDTE